MQASVDVVVPTFNARELLERCLGHLRDSAAGRVIVVDDASDDGTAEMVRERFPEVTLVALEAHRGLAHAFNRGVAAGEAERVLFLNNDVFARPGAVAALARALDEDPHAVAAGGRLVDPGTDRTQDTYRPRDIPGATGLAVRLLGIERVWGTNPWTGRHVTRPLDDRATRRTDRQLPGACLMVRRDALAGIGGWDERYWFWYEDVDLSRRLSHRGHLVYVPKAAFEHVGGATCNRWSRHERHRRLYDGTMRYGEAHLSRPGRAVVGLAAMAATGHRIAVYSVLRPAAAAVYRQVFSGGLALVLGRPLPSVRTGSR